MKKKNLPWVVLVEFRSGKYEMVRLGKTMIQSASRSEEIKKCFKYSS